MNTPDPFMAPSDAAARAGAVLTIDLAALIQNYQLLNERSGSAECTAVVKADAYGLGAAAVGPALAAAGCQTFFVALIDEGVNLRATFDRLGIEANIHVLGGLMVGCEEVCAEHRLTPVLNSIDEISRWDTYNRARHSAGQSPLAADIHIDTGMCRLGLPMDTAAKLAETPEILKSFPVNTLLSHLACAEEPENPINGEQLQAFRSMLAALPYRFPAPSTPRPAPSTPRPAPSTTRTPSSREGDNGHSPPRASLANSSGIFLGPDYAFDRVRPGAALYGVNPTPEAPNPMAQVVRLQGKIVQIRDVDTPQTVGYGATHEVTRPGRIATVSVGYADGYPRSLSNSGAGYIGDNRVTLVGRVSMDLITFDVSDVPASDLHPGAFIDLIGPHNPVDAVADAAGTIGYEILTGLGRRYHRQYTSDTGGTNR